MIKNDFTVHDPNELQYITNGPLIQLQFLFYG